jgi:hypothetical protein
MTAKRCLRCGHDMTGHPWHICPRCGKLFAFYTPAQVALLLVGGVGASVVLCTLLVVVLWRFA